MSSTQTIGSAQYLIRQIGVNKYEVAKFEGTTEPTDTYEVYYEDEGRSSCDCMGFRRRPASDHKHIRLVERFLELGKPWLTMFTLSANNHVWHYNFGYQPLNPHDMWLGTMTGRMPENTKTGQ